MIPEGKFLLDLKDVSLGSYRTEVRQRVAGLVSPKGTRPAMERVCFKDRKVLLFSQVLLNYFNQIS